MTKQKYISAFEKHLRVAEPKRSEILVELNTHLDELTDTQDVTTAMGKPNELAAKYDRVHIGFFYKPWRLYLIPVTVALFSTYWSMLYKNPRSDFIMDIGNYLGWQIGIIVRVFLAIGVAILLPHILKRFQKSKKYLLTLLLITIFSVAATSLVPLDIHGLYGGYDYSVGNLIAYLLTNALGIPFILAVFFGFSAIYFSPVWLPRVSRFRSFIFFESILYVFSAALLFWFLIILTLGIFDPLDGMPREWVHAPENFWKIYHVFITVGGPATLVIGEGALALVFAKRIRRYIALKKEKDH